MSEKAELSIGMDKVWSMGVDYLTLTVKPGEAAYWPEWNRATYLADLQQKAGFELKAWKWNGYNGLTTEGLSCGRRDDSIICRYSSEMADKAFWLIRDDNAQVNATRIDLQVTVKSDADRPNRALQLRNSMIAAAKARGRDFSKETRLKEHPVRGKVLHIGSRQSQAYWRAYDKTREQKNKVEKHLFRFEGEFKGERAKHLLSLGYRSEQPREMARGVVAAGFRKFGIVEAWMDGAETVNLPCCYKETTAEKTLNWFRNFVRGRVEKLILDGQLEDVRMALGLDATNVANLLQQRAEAAQTAQRLTKRGLH
jgi:hypothetical protein